MKIVSGRAEKKRVILVRVRQDEAVQPAIRKGILKRLDIALATEVHSARLKREFKDKYIATGEFEQADGVYSVQYSARVVTDAAPIRALIAKYGFEEVVATSPKPQSPDSPDGPGGFHDPPNHPPCFQKAA